VPAGSLDARMLEDMSPALAVAIGLALRRMND
jgi:Tfp pilus assembly PilM family ATPase